MKNTLIATLLLLVSCSSTTQKLGTINKGAYINKNEFRGTNQLLGKGRSESESFCAGQILFQKNAHDITESSLKALVKSSCPGDKYLQDVSIDRIWWTTIVYSRSCIKVRSVCSK